MIQARHRGLATVSIVLATFTSVLSSTILNVPLHDIAHDLRVSVADATLLSTTALISFATLLPLGGWLGNRFGRRTVFCIAVVSLGLAALVAMFARTLATLVAMRIVQGAASAAIVPVVMTLLADLYEPEQRPFALSAWAMANSLGQALGPPLGGILTSLASWRVTFVPAPILAAVTCIAALCFVPNVRGRATSLEWRGALGLTLGALLLQVAVIAIPQLGVASPVVAALAAAGVLGLIVFARAIRTAATPFVAPAAFREPSYVTSCIAIFAATIAFGAALLATPLYLIQVRRLPTGVAGFVAFALPLAMALSAPLTSGLVARYGSTRSLRGALAALAAGSAAVASCVAFSSSILLLSAVLLLLGAAVACSYTATAVGATSSEAGRFGAGVGLYNLLRIAGSAVGAALVAIILSRNPDGFAEIFTAGAAVNVLVLFATAFTAHHHRHPEPVEG